MRACAVEQEHHANSLKAFDNLRKITSLYLIRKVQQTLAMSYSITLFIIFVHGLDSTYSTDNHQTGKTNRIGEKQHTSPPNNATTNNLSR